MVIGDFKMKIKNTVNLLSKAKQSKAKQSHNYILLINYLSFKLFIVVFSLILFSVSCGNENKTGGKENAPASNPTSKKEEIFNSVPTHKGDKVKDGETINIPSSIPLDNIILKLVRSESDFDGVFREYKTRDDYLNIYMNEDEETVSLTISGNKVTLQQKIENGVFYLKDAQLYKYNNSLYNASYEQQENTVESGSGKMISYIESNLTYLKLIVAVLMEGYETDASGQKVDYNFGAKLVYSNVINTTP